MTETEEVTLNLERELYVIPCMHGRERGHTCLGFDVCLRWGNETAAWLAKHWTKHLGRPLPEPADIPLTLRGTLEAYQIYERIMDRGRELNSVSGLRCDAELVPELIGLEGGQVEVVDKYGETRRFVVGKSTGWRPCHLELKSFRSSGGGSVTGAPFQSVRVLGKKR